MEDSPGPLFDIPAAKKARDNAIDSVARGAGDRRRKIGFSLVVTVCLSEETFTMDDVWYAASVTGLSGLFDEPRAWGAVMRTAQAESICEPTDEWRLSKRPECHRNPKRVWRSLVGR